MPKRKSTANSRLPFLIKLLILSLVILAASWFTQTHYPRTIIEALLPYWMLTAVIVGLMYTSFLTIPFAIIGLYLLSEHIDPLPLALLAGFGAMLGDLLIVKVFRQVFSSFSLNLHIKDRTDWFKTLKKILKAWHLNTLTIVTGAVIVASPLPDEAGLALLGLSDISYTKLMFLTFTLNSIGILLIVAPAYLLL